MLSNKNAMISCRGPQFKPEQLFGLYFMPSYHICHTSLPPPSVTSFMNTPMVVNFKKAIYKCLNHQREKLSSFLQFLFKL